MLRLHRTLVLSALVLAPSSLLHAQSAANPSGHWEGSVKVPDNPVNVEIDLAKNAKGEFGGTLNNPTENVKGIPLTSVSIDGKTIRIVIKSGNAPGAFDGVLSDDGKTITGNYNTDEGGYSIPFSLTRTGEAQARIGAGQESSDRQGAGRNLEWHARRRRNAEATRADDVESAGRFVHRQHRQSRCGRPGDPDHDRAEGHQRERRRQDGERQLHRNAERRWNGLSRDVDSRHARSAADVHARSEEIDRMTTVLPVRLDERADRRRSGSDAFVMLEDDVRVAPRL